jgi:DNA topoisomerase IB
MKKKYYKYYKVIDDIIYDDNDKIINDINLKKILLKYKIPKNFKNVRLIATSVEDADNGIVYIVSDSKNNDQYIYGVNYVNNRRIEVLKIFLNVNSKIDNIYKFIDEELSTIKKYKDITTTSLFALLLLIELNFYIRTGKRKFLKNNETIGLLTLKKKNFEIVKNVIVITFKGKVNKMYRFVIDNSKFLLYRILKLLYLNIKHEDDFIFMDINRRILTENIFYKLINNKFNLKLKDIRTFGVNKILIKELWKEANITNISIIVNKDIKKIISKIINSTANIIGHTPTISKKSYIANELFNIINVEILKKANETTVDEFYNYIIKIISKQAQKNY